MDVETVDYGGLKERLFRGTPKEVLQAALEFVCSEKISPRSIQSVTVSPDLWRISIFYKEV